MPGTGAAASYGDLLVMSLVILGGVCVLAFVLVRIAARVLSTGRVRGAHLLDVVARLPLEPRRSLYVVEVAGKTLLVGTSEMGLSVLSELDGEEVRARNVPRPSFGELVRAAWDRRRGRLGGEGVIDKGVVDKGVVDKGVVDKGVVDKGVVDQGIAVKAVVDNGVVDNGGVVDKGVVDKGIVDSVVVDKGLVDRGVDNGVVDQGVVDQGVVDQGVVDKGVAVKAAVEEGADKREHRGADRADNGGIETSRVASDGLGQAPSTGKREEP